VEESELGIEQETIGPAVVLKLSGRLNLDHKGANVMALKDRLREVMSAKPEWVVVDLTDVPILNSAGISVLITGLKLAKQNGARFSVTGVCDRIKGIFEISRVDTILEIFDTLEHAGITES